MKRFKTENGRIVDIGDAIKIQIKFSDYIAKYVSLEITEDIVHYLIREKYIYPILNLNVDTLNKVLREKYGIMTSLIYFLKNYKKCNSCQLFSILMGLALILDSKYDDNVINSDKLYTISMIDGQIHEIDKNSIKGKNTPLFRTLEDAKIAKNFCGKIINYLFYGRE